MDQVTIEKSLANLQLGPLRFYVQTGSTNSVAADWAEQGAPDLSLVVADEQTAGRGRMGRRWFTPPGAGLAFSLILRPQRFSPGMPLTLFTALGALAISEALREDYHLPSEIKWPNDVLLARRKVSGVLVEAQWQGEQLNAVILGIGINVTAKAVPPDAEVRFPATSVESVLGSPVDRTELLHDVLKRLLVWREQVGQPAFIKAWESQLAFHDEWVDIHSTDQSGQAVLLEGHLLGLESDGCLRLRDRSGRDFTVRTGEVRPRSIDRRDDAT